MRITDTTPIEDGYYMPAEYDRHKATIMIWPVRTGSWPYNAVAAQNVFVDIAHIISRHEKVYILADEKHYAQAEARFNNPHFFIFHYRYSWKWYSIKCIILYH